MSFFYNADKEGKSGVLETVYQDLFKVGRKDLRFLWECILRHRWQVIIGIAVSLPLVVMGGVMAWVGKSMMQSITEGFDGKAVLLWTTVALAAMMVSNLFEIASHVLMTTLHVRITQDIRLDLYDSIYNNSIDFHIHHRSGELANLISNDAQTAAAGSIDLLSVIWQCPLRILFLFGVMLYFNSILALLAVVTVPLLARSVTYVSRRARKYEMQYLQHQSRMLGMMVETLTNVRQVKHFGLENHNRGQFENQGNMLIQTRRIATLIKELASPAAELILGVMVILMVCVAYYQISHNQSTTAAITGCLIAALGLKKPVKLLSKSIVELQRAFAAVRRISWTTGISDQKRNRSVISAPIQRIELDGVSFSYDGRRKVLKDVRVTIRSGEQLAVIGDSGAGKTTLADLINGFYPCTSGDIRINGHSISEIDLSKWRDRIGVVSQEPFLFDVSIKENVRMGNFQTTDEEIESALQAAGCMEMLNRFPEGMETRVGERGVLLSGGERKRVALARIIVRKAALVILDEATSELDSASELHVLETIAGWSPKPIVIHISHRSSILPFCDRVLIVADGQIREISKADAQVLARKNSKRDPAGGPPHMQAEVSMGSL